MKRLQTATIVFAMTLGIGAKGCDVDSDGDGAMDDADNCLEVYNPTQADENGNGIGDACDESISSRPLDVDGCFFSDCPPLHGVNWEDRPILFQQGDVDRSKLYVSIDWTSSDSDWIERGDGTINGTGVWFDIRDEHNPYNLTRTVVEGVATDLDGNGTVDEIVGTYLMLACDSTLSGDDCLEDTYYSDFADGTLHAVRVNSTECYML